MKKLPIVALVLCSLPSAAVSVSDWLAAPSTYTHDPRTAERVNQYTPIGPVYAYPDPTIQSGYRHVRSTIRAGDAADYLHVVEQWGQTPVRPYGEWLRPYRPYSVPYDLWGPQFVDPYAYGGSTYPYPFGYPNGNPGPYPTPEPYSQQPNYPHQPHHLHQHPNGHYPMSPNHQPGWQHPGMDDEDP